MGVTTKRDTILQHRAELKRDPGKLARAIIDDQLAAKRAERDKAREAYDGLVAAVCNGNEPTNAADVVEAAGKSWVDFESDLRLMGKRRDIKKLLARVDEIRPVRENLRKQIATMTAERDAELAKLNAAWDAKLGPLVKQEASVDAEIYSTRGWLQRAGWPEVRPA